MRTVGQKHKFAIEFSFGSDPDQGRGAELKKSASWGAWAIWLKGNNLCRHSIPGGEAADEEHVHWYLWPLIEWLAANWAPLAFEEAPPFASERITAWGMGQEFLEHRLNSVFSRKKEEKWFQWQQRHALRSCREGGLMPDLYIRGAGDSLEFSWGDSFLAGAPEGYCFQMRSPGYCLVDRQEALEVLKAFLTSATDELKAVIPDSSEVLQLQQQLVS